MVRLHRHDLRINRFDHTDKLAHDSDVVRFFAGDLNRLVVFVERFKLNRVMLPAIFGCLLGGMITLDRVPAAVFWIGLRVDLTEQQSSFTRSAFTSTLTSAASSSSSPFSNLSFSSSSFPSRRNTSSRVVMLSASCSMPNSAFRP